MAHFITNEFDVAHTGTKFGPHPQDRLLVELQKRKAGLIAYCQIKLESGDWHAVQDAASDIREIEAKLEILRDGK
jgi:hypothetical protein